MGRNSIPIADSGSQLKTGHFSLLGRVGDFFAHFLVKKWGPKKWGPKIFFKLQNGWETTRKSILRCFQPSKVTLGVKLALKFFCPFFGHFLGSIGQNANSTPRMTFDGSKHLRIDFLVVSYPFLSLEKIFKPHFFGGALFWVNLTKFNEFDLFLLILKASP